MLPVRLSGITLGTADPPSLLSPGEGKSTTTPYSSRSMAGGASRVDFGIWSVIALASALGGRHQTLTIESIRNFIIGRHRNYEAHPNVIVRARKPNLSAVSASSPVNDPNATRLPSRRRATWRSSDDRCMSDHAADHDNRYGIVAAQDDNFNVRLSLHGASGVPRALRGAG